jgi:uncharacterized protein (TIRG00374 family)
VKIRNIITIGVGILIFVYILSILDLGRMAQIFSKTNPLFLFLAAVLFVLMILLKSKRWQILLHLQNISLPFEKLFCFNIIGIFLGSITPGRVGELQRVMYLKEEGYAVGRSFLSVAMDRMFDIFILVAMGGLVVFSPFYFLKKIGAMGLVLLSTMLFCSFVVMKNFDWLSGKLGNVFRWVLQDKKWKKITVNAKDVLSDFRKYRKNLLIPLLITVIYCVVYFAANYMLVLALNIPIGILYCSICMAAIGLVQFLPVSVSGLGTRDATLIFLFSMIGVGKESAVALSVMELFIIYVFYGILSLGALGYLAKLKKGEVVINEI